MAPVPIALLGCLATGPTQHVVSLLLPGVELIQFCLLYWLLTTSKGILTPPRRVIDQSCEFIDLRWLGNFGLEHTIWSILFMEIYKAVNLVLHCPMFSIITLDKVNVSWHHLSRKGRPTFTVQHSSPSVSAFSVDTCAITKLRIYNIKIMSMYYIKS